MMGMTRGFFYAGAERVLVSLWNVDDRVTVELMKRFYHGMLVEGLSPAAALRAAQDAIRRQRHWRSPYFWAGFTLQGEWRGDRAHGEISESPVHGFPSGQSGQEVEVATVGARRLGILSGWVVDRAATPGRHLDAIVRVQDGSAGNLGRTGLGWGSFRGCGLIARIIAEHCVSPFVWCG